MGGCGRAPACALEIVATFGWTRAERIRPVCAALEAFVVLVPYYEPAVTTSPPEWTTLHGWWIDSDGHWHSDDDQDAFLQADFYAGYGSD